jgi:cytochrome c
MKKRLFFSLLLSNLTFAFAQTNEDLTALAKSSGCFACHRLEGKLIGPGYKEVAQKYKNQVGVEDMLSQKIKSGGSGHWGNIPMPSHPQMSDEMAKTLVTWILRGAPAQ